MNQPIIKEYLKAQELNESIVNKTNDDKTKNQKGEISKAELLQQVQAKYFTKAAPNALSQIDKEKVFVSLPQVFFNEAKLKEYIIEGFKEKTGASLKAEKEYGQAQLMILRDFINYQGQAKSLSDLVSITKQDTSTPKNLSSSFINENLFTKIMAETPFINASKLITDTFLKSFKNVQDIEAEVFNEFFVTEKPAFKNAMNLLIEDKLALKREKLEEILDRFKNGFIQYLVSINNIAGKSVASYFKELFMNSDKPLETLEQAINKGSLAQAVKAIQVSNIKFKNNPIFKELVAILTNGDISERSIYDNMKLFSRKMTKYESDVLTSGLRELSEKAETSISKKVFNKLFIFSMIQSGIGNSPFSFYDKLPYEAVAPLVNNALLAYEASGKVNMNEFFIEFYLNNLNNSTLVPKVKKNVLGKVSDDSYGFINDSTLTEAKETYSAPNVLRVPLEGPNSYLSRSPVIKTWVISSMAEDKKKQGKRIGFWLPYVLQKTQDGFNYYVVASPIGNAPYFNQYGKIENITPLVNGLNIPNFTAAVNTMLINREKTNEPSTEVVKEENWTEEENNCKTPLI